MIRDDLGLLPIEICPLCSDKATDDLRSMRGYRVDCEICGKFLVEGLIVPDIRNMTDRHLLSGYTREWYETKGERARIEAENVKTIPEQAPQTIPEKVHKLLEGLRRKTQYFGDALTIDRKKDYPLAYACNAKEFYALVLYLRDRGDVAFVDRTGGVVFITAAGFESLASRSLLPPLTVFISSTCYDLLDLRTELAEHLKENGFIVKLSDNPGSDFDVDPTTNSIDSCLQNVEASDVVVCLLDKRYGPKLPGREVSATHAEIERARELKKPQFVFMRQRAYAEFCLLGKNRGASTLWVEPGTDDKSKQQRERWFEFAKSLSDLPRHTDYSNWVDQFETSVDLKWIVLKRLADYHRSLKR